MPYLPRRLSENSNMKIPKLVIRKNFNKSEIKRILIRMPNWVGDAVMSLPALEAVKENFPECSITLLAKPWVVPLFEDNPAVNRIITFTREGGFFRKLSEMIQVIKEIRNQKFDLAILFQNAFEAALLSRIGGVRFRLGYNTDGRSLLLTHRVIRNEEILNVHLIEYYLSILRAMGWEAKSREPSLKLDRKYLLDAGKLLHLNGIAPEDFLVGLNPGAMFGGAKKWPPDRFAKIGDMAVENWRAKVVILGTRSEMEVCDTLARSMKQNVLNLCGKTTLAEVIGVIGKCNFFVTNDSGLMHISAALGVPTLAIFGPTDHVATGPRGARTKIVKHDIECAPCLKQECLTDHHCMLSIEAEEVWDEMVKFRREE